MGKLRGILLTPTIRSIIQEVLSLPQERTENATTLSPKNDATETNAAPNTTDASCTNAPTTTSPRSIANSTPESSLARVKETKNRLNTPLSIAQARSLLETTINSCDDDSAVLPLEHVSALQLLISTSTSPTKTSLLSKLETSLHPTKLLFSQPQPSKANPAFQKRLDYLRTLSEERSYLASTSNIQRLNAHNTQDDVNVKSMMYATSVGLNMIVAPLSFGVFMYFFAGSIFSNFFPDDSRNNNNVDIRQVIAGVLSGVILLFIEMILFVIRSHELDKSVRRKGKKREYRANPFGWQGKAMERRYGGEMH
jgi:hypothetical protein